MNREEFFEKYVGGKIVVHVPTRKLAFEFMEQAEKHGINYNAKSEFINNQRNLKTSLCILIRHNTWFCSNYEYCKKNGFKIIEYKGEDEIEKPKEYNRSEENRKRTEALKELQSTLEDFVNEYMRPHDTLIVTQRGAEVLSGEAAIPFKLRD